MRYNVSGRSGLRLSELSLGTMNFGELTGRAESFAIMDVALAAGINWFDTSNGYGPSSDPGLSERIIGEWLVERPGTRDDLIISSKVYRKIGDGPNDAGLSKFHLRRSVGLR